MVTLDYHFIRKVTLVFFNNTVFLNYKTHDPQYHKIKLDNVIYNQGFSFIFQLNTSLHEKNHFLSLKQAEFEEQINAEKTKNEELQNKLDDLEYEVTKARMRNGKLESTLAETQASYFIPPSTSF